MKVLITGAAGFIGTAVVVALKSEHTLRLFDVRYIDSGEEAIAGDIADYATVVRAMDGMDAVVHLAFYPMRPGAYDTPEMPMRVNMQGTANVLEAARRAGIRRIVHMSSCAVVTGYSRDTYIHVGLPMKYTGIYNLTKALQEQACRQYCEEHGLTIVALRPWSVVDGPTMRNWDGTPLRWEGGFLPFVCRHDLAAACRAGLHAELTGFQPFHIMVGDYCEQWFDLAHTHQVLGWQPRETFTALRTL